MPGTYSETNRPRRPGAYFNFIAKEEAVIPPSVGSVVAIPIIHDWGPTTPVQVGSMAEFDKIYGDSDTPGRRAVSLAFRGEDLDGIGGAGAVLVCRMPGAAPTSATKILQNTTPAPAITLTARYAGALGNTLTVTTQDNAADTTKTDLIVYQNGVEVERHTYADTDITDLAARLNGTGNYAATGGSDWVTASAVTSGVGLAVVSAQALAGGSVAPTLVAGDWTAALGALEPFRFGVFVPFDLTDSAILTSVKTWIQTANAAGKRFMGVFGGSSTVTTPPGTADTITTANARSATFGDPNILNFGVGSVEDELMLGVGSAPVALSTSQGAPRIAGILAKRGSAQSLTFARLRGWNIVSGPTEQQIFTAFDSGTIVLSRDSDVEAPVRIEKGLTTFTLQNDPNRPYKIYSNPKFVRTMHSYEIDLTDTCARKYIGRLPVNDKTREAVVGEATVVLRAYENAGIIQPGWTVVIPAGASDDDEFVEVETGMAFGRSLEQIFFRTIIR